VKSEKGKMILYCQKCEYTSELNDKATNLQRSTTPRKEKIVVIDKDVEKIRTLPKTKAQCPNCGHNEAYYWMVQTRGGDESTTQFFRCTKCQHTWREYS